MRYLHRCSSILGVGAFSCKRYGGRLIILRRMRFGYRSARWVTPRRRRCDVVYTGTVAWKLSAGHACLILFRGGMLLPSWRLTLIHRKYGSRVALTYAISWRCGSRSLLVVAMAKVNVLLPRVLLSLLCVTLLCVSLLLLTCIESSQVHLIQFVSKRFHFHWQRLWVLAAICRGILSERGIFMGRSRRSSHIIDVALV